jgi:GTP pyrophosphokinase
VLSPQGEHLGTPLARIFRNHPFIVVPPVVTSLSRELAIACSVTGPQLRASGDPYFSHPIEVAGLLAQMKLDTASIITGLLHDTVEDTVATLDDIEHSFGPDIARLVDGVTKLSRIELQSDQTKQAENFRKLVLAMSEDIRVLLVKLADRLHNMQTLRFIKSEEKRRRIARETMDIYVPLAERIGMHQMKDQLEDLAAKRALDRLGYLHEMTLQRCNLRRIFR